MQKDLVAVDPVFGQPTARLLFRKFARVLDGTLAKLATTQRDLDQAKANLERSKAQKRRRVLPDPNKDFVTMQAVHKERARMEGVVVLDDTPLDSDWEDLGEEVVETTEDCIVVK